MFPIVGIGASAGGLEALEQFLSNLPADCGMAFIIIQHLAPDRACILPELLQRVTLMEVKQAGDRVRVQPNSVYIIPPTRILPSATVPCIWQNRWRTTACICR